MKPVAISTKFQVVIPKKIRNHMHIKVGQKMHIIAYDNIITLIPIRPIQEARGSLKGINTNVEREYLDRI
ncbi:MAG: AbrB/MazE/SpoVT family DNA-binding domain-containing protein [Anaerolineales bacterium]|nr:AbrB/MazE/SpoVT family DNA-binding domain-containing protein [Anaerolineales bacterium]